MASFAQFGSDLDENTQKQLKLKVILNESNETTAPVCADSDGRTGDYALLG